jgi:diguanylate cyclase (GGDEF)-like protein/PAS domain S-box-containing protein
VAQNGEQGQRPTAVEGNLILPWRSAPVADDEPDRLAALSYHGGADRSPDQGFDDLVQVAAALCRAPITLISLIDEDTQWIKAAFGFPTTETPRDDAICGYTLTGDDPLVVPDLTADTRFAGHSLVSSAPYLRSYAGVPLIVTGGQRVGTLCVFDHRPRHLEDLQLSGLVALARLVVVQLERQAEAERLREAVSRWLEGESQRLDQEHTIYDLAERFRLTFDEAPTGMALIDLRADSLGQITEVNRSLCQFLGYTPEEMTGRTLQSIGHPDDRALNNALALELASGHRERFEIERRVIRSNGSTRWVIMHTSVLREPNGLLVCAMSQLVDVTARHKHELDLLRAATSDALTGLPNRTALLEKLSESISDDRSEQTALLFIDLDGFKLINDTAGHLVGDEVLQLVGMRFGEVVGPDDTLARLGGDEFAVLCREADSGSAISLAEAIIASLAEPIQVRDGEVYLSASVGVAWATADDPDPGTVLGNADSAMYEAKRRGRSRWELFDGRLRESAATRLRVASDLRAAINGDQFELHYQPIIAFGTGRMVAAEALLRWNHPQRGRMAPGEFIAVAEESGSISAIGRWALDAACREATTWGHNGPSVSVNVSAHQLGDHDLIAAVREALVDSGLTPRRLILEVTETAVMEDAEHAVRVLRDLKGLGVRIAVDDFGTGYSSLLYLKRLPVDELKIDRSFVAGLPDDPEDQAIVSSVIALARAVGLRVVAEGVETAEQRQALKDLGCDYGQGYLWGRPVQVADLQVSLASAEATERALIERHLTG